jgi:hypothetical protein
MATHCVNTFTVRQRTNNHLPSCNVPLVTAVILRARENFRTAAKIIALTTIHVFRDATPLSVGK